MTGMTWAALVVLLAAGSGASGADDPFADNACVQCHRDLPGRSSEIVELEWKKSVHYAGGVACNGCHGGDPSVRRENFDSDEAWKNAAHLERDPEFMFIYQPSGAFVTPGRGRSVSYFCGKCHSDIKEKHLGSPHGAFGDPTCLYCHGQGSHLITKATLAIIDTRGRAEHGRCSPCHMASTMETVSRIKTLLEKTGKALDESEEQSAQLEKWGYRNLELERLHKQAEDVRTGLRQTFHSFNMLEIGNYAGKIEQTAEQTAATYDMISKLRVAQRQQTVHGAAIAVMLLVFALLLVYYRHAFLK